MERKYVKVNSSGVIVDGIFIYGGKYSVHYPGGIPTDWVELTDDVKNKDYTWDGTKWNAPPDIRTYRQKRREDYLPIGDQLDQQYHDLLNGTTTWKDGIAAVKALHPKPTT